jgi:para-aminobenzoate synthetase/4-amino-4-deoxychorismate lyase
VTPPPIGPARLVREPLPRAADALHAARWLRGEPHAVALSGAWAGGGVLLASHPVAVAAPDDDPFALLDSQPAVEGADGVGGGWLGRLGFGLGRTLEPVPPPPPSPQPLPPFDLAFYDHVVRQDADGRWWFEALWTDARADALRGRMDAWRARLAAAAPDPQPYSAGPLQVARPGTRGHATAVAEGIERIAAGEVFQVNLCLRLDGELRGELLDLWIATASELQPSYAAYVAGADHAVASLSPELFLKRRGRTVVSEPIKGTAPAASDPQALAASAKDRAENVMIVDLMRNDLGRVCEYGSISVPRLYELRRAAGVWHLVSTVTGELRADASDGDLLRATFPPGSVTGAPKVRALRVISELEASAREAYCGAIGIASPVSGLELNVAIRSFEATGGRLWLGAGGATVADSDPAGEVDEALTKARGVAMAAGIEIRADGAQAAPPVAAVVTAPRPDPGRGVLETLLVEDGTCVDGDAHLARLAASCDVLGFAPAADVGARVAGAAAALGGGRVRVVVDANGTHVSTGPLPDRGAMYLRPVVLPGGLGAHKWADRTLIEVLSAPDITPLFCDLDGTVLEAGYAAVAIVEDDVLVVPPLDGRILPSFSRERMLATDGRPVVVESFTLDRARQAGAVLLTSTLRGPHAGLLPGSAVPTGG